MILIGGKLLRVSSIDHVEQVWNDECKVLLRSGEWVDVKVDLATMRQAIRNYEEAH